MLNERLVSLSEFTQISPDVNREQTIDSYIVFIEYQAGVAKWQTHLIQVQARAISCRFNSCLRHLTTCVLIHIIIIGSPVRGFATQAQVPLKLYPGKFISSSLSFKPGNLPFCVIAMLLFYYRYCLVNR